MRIQAAILLSISCLAIGFSADVPPGLPSDAPAAVDPPKLEAFLTGQTESPVLFFRRLLPLSAAEREKLLAFKPESQRKVLREKLEEYSLLPPEERDARLQVLQLRFYLLPLMKLAPNARSNFFARIPPEWRACVDERLKQWDLLPPPLQKEVFDKDTTRYYFVRLQSSTPAEKQAILNRFPPERRKELLQELQQWLSLTPSQRQKIYARLDRYMEMTPEERDQVLGVLSEEERRQMQKSLQTFQGLSEDQRENCLKSFQKLTAMSDSDRQLFLANAERWREMSPQERQTWRDLVSALPPLPPEFEPPAFPPMPK